MDHNDKKWNHKRQFKVFGIGLIIAIVIAVILVISDLIKWGVAIGFVVAVMFFELVYFLILRDTIPGPLTQVNMRKGVEFFDENGEKVKELGPGMYKITRIGEDEDKQ